MADKIIPSERYPFLTTVILQSRIAWSIKLRWLAISGYFIATLATKFLFELSLLPYEKIWAALIILAGINIVYHVLFKLFDEFTFITELIIIAIHQLVDFLFLTILIHYSGGIENPIYLFYVFHIVISSIVFPRWIAMLMATVVIIMFSSLVYAEYSGYILHYCVFDSVLHNNQVLIILILSVFSITAYVTAYICTAFMQIYRDSKRIIDRQNKELIEADRQKMQFFRFASHELKSPIVAIKTSLDGVLKTFSGTMDEKAINLLSRSSQRSGQMLEIIKELLELSVNRALLQTKELELVNINDILNKITDAAALHAELKKIRLKIDLIDTDTRLKGKKEDFEKIFANIISNAVRYTPDEGTVAVKSRISGSDFVFEVSDTGIGISERDITNIFGEFFRSENAKKMVNYGTGLGLSLVKQIVENYRGSITVKSEISRGSKFTIRLPLQSNDGEKKQA